MTGPQLTTVLRAPSVVLSAADGQVTGEGVNGFFHADRRALALLQLAVGPLVCVGASTSGADRVSFRYATEETTSWVDPVLMIHRDRTVTADGLRERITVTAWAHRQVVVRLWAATDLAGVDRVRAGSRLPLVPPLIGADVLWQDEHSWSRLEVSTEASTAVIADVVELSWPLTLTSGESWTVDVVVTAGRAKPTTFTPLPAIQRPKWTFADDLAARSLRDLDALLLSDPDAPADTYAAAGSPWYFTLFGRDSLWTASLLLPLDTTLAAGTLRTLARRQGVRHDPVTEEAPGKMPHEARSEAIETGQVSLSPLYYGTIDATALWIRLLHDAWQAGMPSDEVRALLPNLTAAMAWLTGPDADPDGDGLLEYAGSATGGLTNQGWKDSHDGIRHDDGRHPIGPLALCEVQGYAYAAATNAIALADEFGLDATGWATWSNRLRNRFHESFWLADEHGHYPAIALDGAKKPVDGAASNMAHLLGTGLLDRDQVDLVAARLAADDLTTAFGLRTLSSNSAAFNPLSYHLGSVWPHDTAIAMVGLAAEGHHNLADTLAHGIIRAATHFSGRPQELHGVVDQDIVAYPAACSPQAWSAAAVVRARLHLTRE
ncbi:glycogen debranching N-terminal domain-containing protein [Saccharothrix sp. ALI-22-I]|uniref:glycogen debranching N-terminal domain-containing protein n=1 Tax=Saccharothrix sp. ALI-22-I TaxID=1933778 RepID=UPI0015C3A59E|nr:glycogen debranching N-terminal domain-containing protein [Saccharothrix sp. ALI-22-I]